MQKPRSIRWTGHATGFADTTNYIQVLTARPEVWPIEPGGTRSRDHCCRGKAISTTHSECVSLALLIQYAARMRPIILSALDSVEMRWHTVTHGRGSEGETGEWSG